MAELIYMYREAGQAIIRCIVSVLLFSPPLIQALVYELVASVAHGI